MSDLLIDPHVDHDSKKISSSSYEKNITNLLKKDSSENISDAQRKSRSEFPILGINARRRRSFNAKKYNDFYDPRTGLIDRSKYRSLPILHHSRFNEVIESLYYHRDQIGLLLDEAARKNFITKSQKSQIIKSLDFDVIDIDFESQFNRNMKLWTLEAAKVLRDIVTKRVTQQSIPIMQLKQQAAIKILEYQFGKPRTQDEKGSSGGIVYIDDIKILAEQGLIDEIMPGYKEREKFMKGYPLNNDEKTELSGRAVESEKP